MYALVALSAMLAVASAAPGLLGAAPLATSVLSAPLLSRVQVAPSQVNIVRQPITVQQPELVLRQVPVPVTAVSYAAAPVAINSISPLGINGISPLGIRAISPLDLNGIPTLGINGISPLALSASPIGGIVKIH